MKQPGGFCSSFACLFDCCQLGSTDWEPSLSWFGLLLVEVRDIPEMALTW